MFTKRDKKQDTLGKSDFQEFLKVLEDLEDQGDHVTIDSSVTKQIKRPTESHNQNEDDFYFDISGDYSNLKNSFLRKSVPPNHKNKAKKNQSNNLLNSPSTETDSGDEQKIKNRKRMRKNKNIYLKYKYNDNCDKYSNLTNKSGADIDMYILKPNVNPLMQIDKQQNPSNYINDMLSPIFASNVSTLYTKKFPTVETCPSICGSTDDDITEVDLSGLTNISTHFENDEILVSDSRKPSIQEEYFKKPTESKNVKTVCSKNVLQNECPTFIDIRDSDCEMATFLTAKEKFKTKHINSVNKSKKRKRTSSSCRENVSTLFDDYASEKRLKFVDIADSDCEMSLYSKTKNKKKLKKTKSRDKESTILDNIKNLSTSESMDFQNLSTDSPKSSEENDFTNVEGKDQIIDMKRKLKTDVDRYNYNLWKKDLETTKNIFAQNGKNKSTDNIFVSVDQMNWNDDKFFENTKKTNFNHIRDSDSEISVLSKTKKKTKKKSKHKKNRINISNDLIQNSEIKTDSELEKVNEIINEKDINNHGTLSDTPFTNTTIENLVNNETYYDLKFNNMEEIKKDFDTSGISFGEDLSVIEHNNSSHPKCTIKKEHVIKTISAETIEKVPTVLTSQEKSKHLKNVNMCDLDVTKLSVLLDLKSVKQNNINSKSPRKFFNSQDSDNKVVIKVSYSDSSKYEQNWSIGINNIDGNKISTIKENLNTNEDNILQNNVNCGSTAERLDESENQVKSESFARIDNDDGFSINITNNLQIPKESLPTSLEAAKEINRIEDNCEEVKNGKCETANPTKDILKGICLEQIESSKIDTVTNENWPISQLEYKELLSDRTESPGHSSENDDISDLQHQENSHVQISDYDTDDTDDIFKDEPKSENNVENKIKYADNFSNYGNEKPRRESHDKDSLEAFKIDIEDEQKFEETAAIRMANPIDSVYTPLDPVGEWGNEAPNFEVLNPVQHTSVSSNFDDINLSDINTTVQNINLEELKQAEEHSLKNKPVMIPEPTEDFIVFSQPESDNETNLNSLLIFEDLNDVALNDFQQQDIKLRSQSDDQVIMELEVFMGLQNVEDLIDNLTKKEEEEEIDVVNYTTAIIPAEHIETDTLNGIESYNISNVALQEDSQSENKDHEEIIPISEIKQSNSEHEADDVDVSDCSNYSDEVKTPSKKRNYIRDRKMLTRIDTRSQSRKLYPLKKEDSCSEHSDTENDNTNLEKFLRQIKRIAYHDNDFSDVNDGDYDIDVINDDIHEALPSKLNSMGENHSDLKEYADHALYRPVTEDDIEDIQSLRIKLSSSQSVLHRMVTRSSVPTKEQHEAVRKAGIITKTGVFSSDEDEIIKRNWESFLTEHNLDIPPTSLFKLPSRMRLEQKVLFVKYLSQGLDNRWPHSVHERFKNIYLNKKWKTGRYTKKEDKIILDYLAQTESRQPYKDLEKILNRPAYNILQRFRYYRKDKKNVTKWTLEEMEKLIKYLMKISKCNDTEELRHRKFSEKEWRKLAKHMKNGMTAHHVKYAWKSSIHYRLFSDDVPLPIVKAELLKRLEEANVAEWKHINWDEISKDFHGYNSTYLCLAFGQISHQIPPAQRKNLKECLAILREKYPTETPSQKTSTAHKKLKWENGCLKYRDQTSDNNS